jgi:hypothetical protein
MSSFQRFLQSLQASTHGAAHNPGLNLAEGTHNDVFGDAADVLDCLNALGYEVQGTAAREM